MGGYTYDIDTTNVEHDIVESIKNKLTTICHDNLTIDECEIDIESELEDYLFERYDTFPLVSKWINAYEKPIPIIIKHLRFDPDMWEICRIFTDGARVIPDEYELNISELDKIDFYEEYASNGFNVFGIHKHTGTEYNQDGYDINGMRK